jgi:hypothetical protein
MSRVHALALLGLAVASPLRGQAPAALQVHGLEPGIAQADLGTRVGQLGGKLACHGSTANSRLGECLATLSRAPDHRGWTLRASLVEGTAAILILTSPISDRDLDRLREQLIADFGRPNLRNQGAVRSYEWIRSGRMMRLTTNGAADWREVSISLVDGAVLDRLSPES